MARRRALAGATRVSGVPDELLVCRVEDWTSGAADDLECDRAGRCNVTGTGSHDEWCATFTARRRWYAARAQYPQPLPHARPQQTLPHPTGEARP